MKKRLLIALILIMQIVLVSCEDNYQSTPASIKETTWVAVVTNTDNTTISSLLKFYETTYDVVTTYVKEGIDETYSSTGTFSYTSPTVTLIKGGSNGQTISKGTILEAKMYISATNFVFEMKE